MHGVEHHARDLDLAGAALDIRGGRGACGGQRAQPARVGHEGRDEGIHLAAGALQRLHVLRGLRPEKHCLQSLIGDAVAAPVHGASPCPGHQN